MRSNVPPYGLPPRERGAGRAVPIRRPWPPLLTSEKRLLVEQGSTLRVVAGDVAIRTADPLWAQARAAAQKGPTSCLIIVMSFAERVGRFRPRIEPEGEELN